MSPLGGKHKLEKSETTLRVVKGILYSRWTGKRGQKGFIVCIHCVLLTRLGVFPPPPPPVDLVHPGGDVPLGRGIALVHVELDVDVAPDNYIDYVNQDIR